MTQRNVLRNVPRRALRSGVLGALIAMPLLAASPAFAEPQPAGGDPGTPLGALNTILIFVGIPIGAFLFITALVMLPSWARSQRYRPGLGWWAAPVWFGGPRDSSVVAHATDPAALAALPVVKSSSSSERGGASARW